MIFLVWINNLGARYKKNGDRTKKKEKNTFSATEDSKKTLNFAN